MHSVATLIVDDHPLFRQGVRFALANERDITIVGEASSGEEALQLLEQLDPAVIITDLNLPGMGGIELTRKLRREYPSIGVIVLSVYQSDEHTFNALRAGAAAYYSKDISPATLAEALRRVARGEYVINDVMFEDPRIAARILNQFRDLHASVEEEDSVDFTLFSPLSEREIEVLERIAQGESNKKIADSLSISTQTVKNHISSILRKLSLNDRTQAVLYALRRGWIERPELRPGTSNANNDDVDRDEEV